MALHADHDARRPPEQWKMQLSGERPDPQAEPRSRSPNPHPSVAPRSGYHTTIPRPQTAAQHPVRQFALYLANHRFICPSLAAQYDSSFSNAA